MKDQELPKAISAIKKAVRGFKTPAVSVVAETKDPYKILISCILSLRTQDGATADASSRLFGLAATPQKMLGLEVETVEDLFSLLGR